MLKSHFCNIPASSPSLKEHALNNNRGKARVSSGDFAIYVVRSGTSNYAKGLRCKILVTQCIAKFFGPGMKGGWAAQK